MTLNSYLFNVYNAKAQSWASTQIIKVTTLESTEGPKFTERVFSRLSRLGVFVGEGGGKKVVKTIFKDLGGATERCRETETSKWKAVEKIRI